MRAEVFSVPRKRKVNHKSETCPECGSAPMPTCEDCEKREFSYDDALDAMRDIILSGEPPGDGRLRALLVASADSGLLERFERQELLKRASYYD